MSDAQTEARAIARLEYVHGSEGYALRPDAGGRYVLYTDHATALAAKDVELAVQREAKEHARRECDRAEAQLAEARKAHSTILAVLGNVEHRGGGPNAARMYADMLNDIREIARRALTGGQEDG